ncbi:hypothetical protein [Moorena sp. SIO2C4]|uniref:hypothetical protein n=1 Tax=Moorena sp. SIO2C4 TaxID=2607824 RepID=UPI0010FA7C90|nr:hypothetical protein [Moorena sp. SIO2C4]NEQ18490.1 hypothetical protein [Moorena sp. SIO3E2]
MRYGADYPNPGYEAKIKGKSAPNAPYAPDSRFPIPDSRFPTPDSRFPIPDSLFPLLNYDLSTTIRIREIS